MSAGFVDNSKIERGKKRNDFEHRTFFVLLFDDVIKRKKWRKKPKHLTVNTHKAILRRRTMTTG